MTAIFMPFSRNRKQFRKRKTEITGKYGRKVFADERGVQTGKEEQEIMIELAKRMRTEEPEKLLKEIK